MYIAIKWLIVLAIAMWVTLCCIDILLRRNKEIQFTGPEMPTVTETVFTMNMTIPMREESHNERAKGRDFGRRQLAILHYLMFFAGAFVVTVFNRKNEIICYTKNKLIKLYVHTMTNFPKINWNKTASKIRDAITNYSKKMLQLKQIILGFQNIQDTIKMSEVDNCRKLNILLLRKLRDIGEERNRFGQLLLAAIDENKNIRMQFQLETLAKNRLMRHIEDTQKQIKDNRSRYVGFQQLYLVTHQENLFLQSRLSKLSKDKEVAERNLMSVVNEIYRSKNSDLKAYCTRCIVQTTENLMNNDADAEIQKFLVKSCHVNASTASWQIHNQSNIGVKITKSWPCTRVTDLKTGDESLVPADAPKLRGLPGECVWTVKDKNGLIEKLYEYDYGYNFNNGNTIRRIREYTVYHDKDCLLDFSNSRTVLESGLGGTSFQSHYPDRDLPASQKFLTGSKAFQKFLQNNKNIAPSRSHFPPLLCD